MFLFDYLRFFIFRFFSIVIIKSSHTMQVKSVKFFSAGPFIKDIGLTFRSNLKRHRYRVFCERTLVQNSNNSNLIFLFKL